MVGIAAFVIHIDLLDVAEHGALYSDVGLIAQLYTTAGYGAAVEALHDVYLSESHAGHTGTATLIPPATQEGGAQMPTVLRLRVA